MLLLRALGLGIVGVLNRVIITTTWGLGSGA